MLRSSDQSQRLGAGVLGVSLAAVLTLACTGCGSSDFPELGSVTGTITRDGKPLANAWVEFEPEEGRLSAATTDSEGHYDLQYSRDAKGAIVGAHTVKIGTGGQQSGMHSAAARNDTNRAPQQLFEKSGVVVDSGDNTLDFEITEGNEYQATADGRAR